MTDSLAAALREYPVGGVLLSAQNMTSGEQLAALTAALSSASATAPLVTVDEEGGRVARLMNTVGTTKLNSMYSYRSLGTQGAYDNAQTLAHDIAAYGFNTDFAPVADVWTNKKSNAIGDRAYSDDYDEAAELVAAAVSGFRDAGVICCLKHFPGHGSTATDSHNGAATVDKTLPQLRQEDLKPFVSGIAAGADMVMVGHLTVPTMDDVPASLSHKIVTNLLRYDLGFRGVIVTDGLQMQALAQYTDGEKAVLALAAGNDMLLEISDVPGAVAAWSRHSRTARSRRRRSIRACCACCSSSSRTASCRCRSPADTHDILRKVWYLHAGRGRPDRRHPPFFLPPTDQPLSKVTAAALRLLRLGKRYRAAGELKGARPASNGILRASAAAALHVQWKTRRCRHFRL